MSLINDALRRAKDAQQQTPPPTSPELPFRPVEPAQQAARHGLSLLLPAALGALALMVLLFAWALVRTRTAPAPLEVNARTANVPPGATPAPAPAVQPTPVQQPLATAAHAASAGANLASDTTAEPADEPLASVEESEPTNAPVITAPPPPKPAPLRLQAIIFNPNRPSAMIGGKTLFIGDKLGDLRVVAIDKVSVTLTGVGQTKILSLAE